VLNNEEALNKNGLSFLSEVSSSSARTDKIEAGKMVIAGALKLQYIE
jgi:hypothetical protein